MLILKADADGVEVRLTGDELHMLNNALNEVCNGVRELSDDGEFQTRLGFERKVVDALLDEIGRLSPSAGRASSGSRYVDRLR